MPPNETSPLLAEHGDRLYDTYNPDLVPELSRNPWATEPGTSNGAVHDAENGFNGAVNGASNGGVNGNSQQREQDPNVPLIPGVNLAAVVPAMAIGIFLSALDNTIVVASYGRIGTELNELNRTSWLSTAYLLTTTAFQPLYGRLSDIYGRKACLIFAYTVFGIGCFLCGISNNMNHLIAARAFAGIGGGGMNTVSSILMSDIVPLRTRGTWQGVLNIIFAMGSASGGPLGGWLADTVGWRWAFLGQSPITLMAILAVTFGLHLPKAPTKLTGVITNREVANIKTKLLRVDFPGALTLILAIFSFLISLDLGVNSIGYPISSPVTLSIFLVSLLLFIGFYHIEKSYSAEPFCPPDLVKRREILAPCLANFFSFGSAMAVIFHIPLFYQAVLHTTAAAAGQRLLPMILGGVIGSLGGGFYMQKTGKYYWLTFGAYLSQFMGVGVITTCISLTGTGPSDVLLSAFMIMGMVMNNVGVGVGVTSTLIALISNVKSAEQAVATALSYLFRSMGSVLGLSLCSGLVQMGLKRRLIERLGNVDDVLEIVAKVRRDLDSIDELGPERAAIARSSYQGGLTDAMFISLVLSFLCWVSSWGIREVRVKK